MPPDKSAQNTPQEDTTKKPAGSAGAPPAPPQAGGGIDLSKILLPKKDAAPLPGNAQRVNAGVLLEAEQSATLKKSQALAPTPAAAAPPPAPPKPKRAAPSVPSIETYQGDIEGLVQSKNVSVLSIAAAEAARRGVQPQETPSKINIDIAGLARQAGAIGGALLILAAAGGLLWWVLQPPRAVEVKAPAEAPFIKIDSEKVLTLPAGDFSHQEFIQALVEQRDQVALSLGLIERLQLAVASTTPQGQVLTPITAQTLLTYLSPSVPDALLRAVKPTTYLFAIHSFEGNQPLLMLEADSYEGAYAGMLGWERDMRTELAPLFVRKAPVHIQQTPPAPVAPAGTSTPGAAATSTATSTAEEAAPAVSVPLVTGQTGFVDDIVENHDVRAVKNADGDILLLWTFINRRVLVITTNEATLREVISRVENSPILPTP